MANGSETHRFVVQENWGPIKGPEDFSSRQRMSDKTAYSLTSRGPMWHSRRQKDAVHNRHNGNHKSRK